MTLRGSRPLTMRRIGELAGVSQSTVSRVLSGATSGITIAPETRARILRVVEEVGFSPNPLARALRGARTALLGLIVRDIEDLFFTTAIVAITAAARREGYNVILGHVESSADEALALSEVLQAGHCDGIIVLGDLRGQSRLWADLRDRRTPTVGIWHGARTPEISVVNVDNRRGVRLALEYLVELGHQRIAFLQGGRTGDGTERHEAYVDFMRERALAVPTGYVEVRANDFAEAAQGTFELLAREDRPTAVVASTDVAAIGALKAASTAGLEVPAELSVVGFDDIPLAAFTVPSLTTVRQPMEQLAQRAVMQLLTLMEHPDAPKSRLVLEPSLAVRDSCSAPVATGKRHVA